MPTSNMESLKTIAYVHQKYHDIKSYLNMQYLSHYLEYIYIFLQQGVNCAKEAPKEAPINTL